MQRPVPQSTPYTAHPVQPSPKDETAWAVAAALTREAANWSRRVAGDVKELAAHDGALVAEYLASSGRRAVFGVSVATFTALRVPRAVGRLWLNGPSRRPSHALYPEDYPPRRDWLVKLPEGSQRDDVCTVTPLVGAFALGRTLPRNETPDTWWEPIRAGWVAAHTAPVWIPPYRRYCHLLVLGGPGTGKTSRWIIPALVRDLVTGNGHILTVDAKQGEQYRLLYAAACRAGVEPVCLDPWATSYTSAVEPLGSATPAQLEVLADALYGGAGARADAEDFWTAYAKMYLRFLLTLVALLPRASRAVPCVAWLATEETPRVTELADTLLRRYGGPADDIARHVAEAVLTLARVDDTTIADARGRPDAVSDALATIEFLPQAVLDALRVLRARAARGDTVTREHAAHVGGIARDALRDHCERLRAARRQVRELEREGNEKLAGSTRATLAAHLRAYTLPEVSRFLSRPEVNLWEFASTPWRRVLCVGTRPGQGAASEQVAGLVVELAFHSVYTRNELPDGNPVKSRPVWVFLDEVAQLKLRDLPRHLALVRSMNCGIVLAAQDLSQLRVIYGELATAVETSCGTVIALDRLEDATAARYAERLGPVEICRHVPSSAPNQRYERRYDTRNLLEPADLRVRRINGRLRRDAAFQAQGVPHWFARPDPYYEDRDIRSELGLVRSGGRWTPAETPPVEREEGGAGDRARADAGDPFGETVLALVAVPHGGLRPALRVPTVPWRAFGLRADDDGPDAPAGALGPGTRLLPTG